MERMRVTVTGSLGYVGSALVRKLDPARFDIQHIDKLAGEDILEDSTKSRIMGFDPHAIVNLAGVSGTRACRANPELAYRVNARAPALLARLCPRAAFLQASTHSVFNPVACPYATTKRSAETLLGEIHREVTRQAPTVAMRFPTLYGVAPRMRWDLPLHKMVADGLRTGEIGASGELRPWGSVNLLAFHISKTLSNLACIPLGFHVVHLAWFVKTMRAMARDAADVIHRETAKTVKVVDNGASGSGWGSPLVRQLVGPAYCSVVGIVQRAQEEAV